MPGSARRNCARPWPVHTDTSGRVRLHRLRVAPEVITDGRTRLAIVRHNLGCPTPLAQSRARWAWADKPSALPETSAPVTFAHLGAQAPAGTTRYRRAGQSHAESPDN